MLTVVWLDIACKVSTNAPISASSSSARADKASPPAFSTASVRSRLLGPVGVGAGGVA